MGASAPNSVLVQSGFVTEAEQAALRVARALSAIFFRATSMQMARSSMPDSTPAPSGSTLRYCAEREFSIGVAAGRAKRPIALACLRARYLNVLVTDEQTALFLLDEVHHG